MLTSADARIVFVSRTACSVELTLSVDGATELEHRIEAFGDSSVRNIALRGATMVRDMLTVGRTRSLIMSPGTSSYAISYTAQLPEARAFRCPLWIPTASSDGRSRDVRLTVTLPPGATAAGTFPAFRWSGTDGTATLGHLPAFVHVPFAALGDPAPWNVGRVMDIVTVVVLMGASLAWARRRRFRVESAR